MDLTHGFVPRAFAAATARLDPGSRRYTSLVPTQLVRLLDDPVADEALHCYDAVRLHRLPPELANRNPTGTMWRLIDGAWTQKDVDA